MFPLLSVQIHKPNPSNHGFLKGKTGYNVSTYYSEQFAKQWHAQDFNTWKMDFKDHVILTAFMIKGKCTEKKMAL